MKTTFKLKNIYSLTTGIVTYIYIFGLDFLNNKTSFFYEYDHPMFHAGYLAYINDEWKFPLTITDNLFPNENFSIVWMDSIPIFSLILKVIYTTFGIKVSNPFPIWYLICYVLFAYYIGKTLQLRIKNNITYLLSLIFIVNTPLMVNRMVWHSALAAHWLIVASIYFYIKNKDNNFNSLKEFALLTGISIFIHPYIFSMVFSIFVISYLLAFKKTTISELKKSAFVIFGTLATYFVGFFRIADDGNYSSTDYYKYGAEFNSFFCGEYTPEIINKYLWCYPPFTTFTHEGYAYFGLGVIFLSIFLIFNLKNILVSLNNHWLISLALSFMLLYSFGNKWKIAHYQFFEFEPTFLHMKILEIFRATGRYSWPIYYFFLFFLVFRLLSLKKQYILYPLLLIGLTLQIIDVSNIYNDKSEIFQTNISTTKQQELSKKIYNENPDEVMFVLPDERCSWGHIDHYVVALQYLEKGGALYSTRTARLKINGEICSGYNVENDIKANNPFHFVISDLNLLNDKNILFQYTCEEISKFSENELIPVYCKKST